MLQTGRIYVRQNPTDAQLTIDELCLLVNNEDELIEWYILVTVYVGQPNIGLNKEVNRLQWSTI